MSESYLSHSIHGHAADSAAAAELRARLLDNPTATYQPVSYLYWMGMTAASLDGKPVFTWLDIPRMVRDPQVRLVERMWRAPFRLATWQVKAEDPRVARFVDATLRRFWWRSLPRLLKNYFRWGHAPGGAEFRSFRGRIRLDRVKAVEPQHAAPHQYKDGKKKGQFAGFVADGIRVMAPHAMWFAGSQEYSPYHDFPPLAGMFNPWLEKNSRNGGLDQRVLYARKNASRGDLVRFPPGTTNLGTRETPRVIQNADLARQVANTLETGATCVMSSERYPQSDRYQWDITPPQATAEGAGRFYLEYLPQLDREMTRGAGIPDEVLEASKVGSGWSGRTIPLMQFFGGVDEFVGLIVDAADSWLKYAVWGNYGRGTWYEVEPDSLVKKIVEDGGQQPGGPGGAVQNAMNPAAGNGEGWSQTVGPRGGHWMVNRRTGAKRHVSLSDSRVGTVGSPIPRETRREVRRLLRERDRLNPPAELADDRADRLASSRGGKIDPHKLLLSLMLRVQERATARGRPETAEPYLRHLAALARDPDRLNEVLAGARLLSWEPYEGPRGGKGWKNSETGRVLYTTGDAPGERRKQQRASAVRAQELAGMIDRGLATPEHLEELAGHLPALTVDNLRNVRNRIGLALGGKRRRAEMEQQVMDHVRGLVAAERAEKRAGKKEGKGEGKEEGKEEQPKPAEEKPAEEKPAEEKPTGQLAEIAPEVIQEPPSEQTSDTPPAAIRHTPESFDSDPNATPAHLTREDYRHWLETHAETHHMDPKRGLRGDVFPGDTIILPSRGKKPWMAKLGGKDKKYGRQREFVRGKEERSGMRKQIVTHQFTPEEPGEYEAAGNEFGDYRHGFNVVDPDARHRDEVEAALKSGRPLHEDVLADYPDLAAKHAPHPAATEAPGQAGIDAALAEYHAAPEGSLARRSLDAALGNLGIDNPAKPPATLPRTDPKDVAGRLTAAWIEAHKLGASPADLAPIERAMKAAGAEPVGTAGETAPFAGEYHEHEGETAPNTGTPVRVVRPGWAMTDEAGRVHRLLPAKVAGAGAERPAVATPAPAAKEPHEMSRADYLAHDRGKPNQYGDTAAPAFPVGTRAMIGGREVELASEKPERVGSLGTYRGQPGDTRAKVAFRPVGSTNPYDLDNVPLAEFHRGVVEHAVAAGKPVPSEVLADYPDLAAKYGGQDKPRVVPATGREVPPAVPLTPAGIAAESPSPTPEGSPDAVQENRPGQVPHPERPDVHAQTGEGILRNEGVQPATPEAGREGPKEVTSAGEPRGMDVVAAARQLQTGRHRVETVEALRPHLEQLPKAQVAGIARELGYNAISTLPKGEMIHKLISNLKGISLSKQRVWEIEHGRSRPVAFDENPFAAGPPAAAEAGREGGGQGEVAPSPAAVVKRAIGDAIRAGNHQAFPFGQHVHRIPMKVLRDALAKAGIHDRAAQDEAIYEATWRDKAAKGKGKHSVTGLHATPEEHESYKHHALPGVGEQFGAFEVPVAHAGFWTGGEGGAAAAVGGAGGGDAAAGHEPEPATPPGSPPPPDNAPTPHPPAAVESTTPPPEHVRGETPPPAGNPGPQRPGPVPEPDERGTGGGRAAGTAGPGGAESARPRIVTARLEFTRTADPARVPARLREHLNPAQTEGAALAIDAMEKHGGFLLADGTGVGKTRQQLAVGQHFLDAGKKVVIVSPAEVIKPDWKKGAMAGSFAHDSAAMGVPVKLTKGDGELSPGTVHVTTYNELGKLKDKIDGNTVLILDESHFLKNRTSARHKHGKEAMDKAGAVMYATATPGDKPLHIAHLFRAGVFGNAGATKTYEKLGMRLVDQHVGGGQYRKVWQIDPKVGHAEAARRLSGLFDQMTKDGLMVKRELSMNGVDVGTHHVALTPDQRADVEKVYQEKYKETGGNKAVALMAARLHQEPMKVPATADMVREELAAGRSPVIFVGRVNDIAAGGDTDSDEADDADDVRSHGTAKALKEALVAAGIPEKEIGEMHGGATKTADQKKKAMDAFQSGKTRVMIATVQSGGTGVNLDDTAGDRPRTAIMMTPPFTANDMAQAIGRVHRLNTKSAAKVRGVLSDTAIDQWNAAVLAHKFRTLGAIAGGEIGKGEGAVARPDEVPEEAHEREPYDWGTSLHHVPKYRENTPFAHKDMAAKFGGRPVKDSTGNWTTEFPSREAFDKYREHVAANRPPSPAPAKSGGGDPARNGFIRNKFDTWSNGQKIPAGKGWVKRNAAGKWVGYTHDEAVRASR